MSDNLKTWPDRIWLQHSEDGYPVPAYKVETDEITWCEDKQHDCDIEYVRADRIAELERQLAELRGAAQPVAWFTEDHMTDKSATTWDSAVAERWRSKGWPVGSLVCAAAMQAGKGPE